MSRWILVAGTALVACAGQSEPGPIGQPLDLRPYLPDSLRTATSGAADSTFVQEIRVGPDTARVELVWTSFAHDHGRYLATVRARLLAPVKYDSLAIGDVADLRNSGTKSDVIENASIRIKWFKRTPLGRRTGSTKFGFGAAGSRTIGPAEAK